MKHYLLRDEICIRKTTKEGNSRKAAMALVDDLPDRVLAVDSRV